MFLIFFVSQVLVSAFVIGWPSFWELLCLLHLSTFVFHFHKQFCVVVSDSLIGQSSLSFITVLHMFEHVLFYYRRQVVVTSLSSCLKKSSMSSSQVYIDFYHDKARSEKRYIVACVKTQDNTGTYISLKLFKKKRRQRISFQTKTHSLYSRIGGSGRKY